MRSRTIVLAALLVGLASIAGPRVYAAEHVIVLHGLYRTDRAMSSLADALVAAGYDVDNLRYPSVRRPIEELVQVLAGRVEQCCTGAAAPTRLHFVGHSLGAIVVRAYLEQTRPPSLGKVVMIAPPNSGSEVVDVFAGKLPFGFVLGPSGRRLGTGDDALPTRLARASFDVGIIAGNRSLNPLFSWLIPGEDDGAVSIEATKLEGMRDFIVVPHTHTFIMAAEDVHRHVVSFLADGAFDHDGAGGRDLGR